MNAQLKPVKPANQNRSVHPTRPPNAELRTREHLLPAEIDKLIAAARKHSRYLEWSQIDFDTATMHVRRVKNGKPATHPIRGDEMRALRKLRRDTTGPYVFTSERGSPFTPAALNRHIKRLGDKTSIGFQVHVHMLRHACGYALANAGHDTRAIQDYLGHKAIQHTVRYTELSPVKFKDFWRD